MKAILTRSGQQIIVDDSDYETLRQWNWSLDSYGYARRNYRVAGKQFTVKMHRAILGLCDGDGMEVDHVNGNRADNRRENLRVCTHAENLRNKPIRASNTTGFKGVSLYKPTGMFKAQIRLDGKTRHLGYFNTAEEAHDAYCKAASNLHGDFANFGVDEDNQQFARAILAQGASQ